MEVKSMSKKDITLKPLPNPSISERDSPIFNAIWEIIKDWDISDPNYYYGYMSGNGGHVKLILDKIIPFIRSEKIDQIIE